MSASPTNFNKLHNIVSIGTTLQAINVSGLVAPGWANFINRDPTNTITIYESTGTYAIATLPPGMPFGPVLLAAGMQAPKAIAAVAACELEVLILDS